jgi:hypothetical protein
MRKRSQQFVSYPNGMNPNKQLKEQKEQKE